MFWNFRPVVVPTPSLVFLKTIVFRIENSLYFKKKELNRGCQKQNICNSAIIILRQEMFNFYETVNLFPWSIKTKDKEFYHQIYAKPLLLPSVETLKLFYAPTKPFYVTNSTTWNVLLKSKSSFYVKQVLPCNKEILRSWL